MFGGGTLVMQSKVKPSCSQRMRRLALTFVRIGQIQHANRMSSDYNNVDPRAQQAELTGYAKRAVNAMVCAFELQTAS